MPYFLINFFLSTIWRALNWPHLSHITLQDCFLNAFPRFIDNYNVAQETGSEFILKTVIQCISIQNPPSFKTDVNGTFPANCTVFRPDANANCDANPLCFSVLNYPYYALLNHNDVDSLCIIGSKKTKS